MNIKHKAVAHAMDFESIYDYSDYYKIDENQNVWKYMDLEKFQSLLDNRALFFAKPGAFIDPLEGSYSQWDIERLGGNVHTREEMREIQEHAAISCWHTNDHESAGMWDLYLNSKDGVAIKTDYIRLINSINDLRYRIFTAKIQYIDFSSEMTSINIFDTLFFKRKSFSHEKELRLLTIAGSIERYLGMKFEREGLEYEEIVEKIEEIEKDSFRFSNSNGNFVSCDLSKMIQSIYVSPNSSDKIVTKVKQMVSNSGLNTNIVTQSDLYKDYIY